MSDQTIAKIDKAMEAVYAAARAQLKRDRQGCMNILEFRKLSSEKWGQADGYGGRYGALTREELDAHIADIDAMLDRTSDRAAAPTDLTPADRERTAEILRKLRELGADRDTELLESKLRGGR